MGLSHSASVKIGTMNIFSRYQKSNPAQILIRQQQSVSIPFMEFINISLCDTMEGFVPTPRDFVYERKKEEVYQSCI